MPKPPRFPVLLHETFIASGYYREDFTRREHFERLLSRERLECNFWQNGRRLAHFKGALINLLDLTNSVRSMRSTENGFPCNLILKPSTCFPGIIGPKCVMRVELDVAELHYASVSAHPSSVSIASLADWRSFRSHSCLPSGGDCCHESTNTSSCTSTAASNHKKCRRLQKPVCHVRQRSARFVYLRRPTTLFDKSYSLLTQFAIFVLFLFVFFFSFLFFKCATGTA